MTLNQLLVINISLYIVSNMNARYARVSLILSRFLIFDMKTPIRYESDIRYLEPWWEYMSLRKFSLYQFVGISVMVFGLWSGFVIWEVREREREALFVDFISFFCFSHSYLHENEILTRPKSNGGQLKHLAYTISLSNTHCAKERTLEEEQSSSL